MRALVAPALEGKGGDQAANHLSGACLSETCLYAARLMPEIANSVVDVDRAIRWGFAWELGPFEMWDAIGVERMAKALEREGKKLPPLVEKVLASPGKSFYETENGNTRYFDYSLRDDEAGGRAERHHHSEIAERTHARSAKKFRGQPDRFGRWRDLLRIPFEDECHRR